MAALAESLKPCGPVVDKAAAERVRQALGDAPVVAAAWPALAPVAGASHYLGGLMRRDPERLVRLLEEDPDAALARVLAETAGIEGDGEGPRRTLRRLKAELHLLTALCDLGGVWDLDQVTGALTRFADQALVAALALVAREAVAAGRLEPVDGGAHGPVPGLFLVAMGKHGAFELNYSSDIDVSVFYAPEALPLTEGAEAEAVVLRLARDLVSAMQDKTSDGYVFRMDLRLRPDPSSTPVAVPVEAALHYYESVGQNWERAATIKARIAAGDFARGQAFLKELLPFVWRRTLDFAAVEDIHSIKRQIHIYKTDDRLTAPGANLKLGRGGIREIEFFVQTQQLILGGRDPSLRSPRTLDALQALAKAGHVKKKACEELSAAYVTLRDLEHRVQMLADEQTHILPEAEGARRQVAALSGQSNLARFDASVEQVLKRVNARYGELFAEDEPLSSRFGSLVFTGVEDDPETLLTLARMGFSQPARISATIRAWHHGHIAATHTARGRELFTRLAPRLLEAAEATGAPDAAFARFADFFSRLTSGVQIQSLFLAQPKLFELIVQVLAFAPELARTLAKKPAALDALLDATFFAPLDGAGIAGAVVTAVADADGFEAAMDQARRAWREQAFRVGVQVMSGSAGAEEAGRAFAALADACIGSLAHAALCETHRIGGAMAGEAAVVALGKAGSREMTAGSDLDLMTIYEAAPDAMSEKKGWGAEILYTRFTQRLITALSAQTAEGGLYEVDMRLRPSGAAGPVAVRLQAFESYYAGEAETWEHMVLTRARVAWATSPAFAARVNAAILTALRRPRDPEATAHDVAEMRALVAKEKPPKGMWDLKLTSGGLVDVEFAAQHLQLVHAPGGGPTHVGTLDELRALEAAGLLGAELARPLVEAFSLQQSLSQLLKLALSEAVDPSGEPPRFKALLADAGGAKDFAALTARLKKAQAGAHEAFLKVVATESARPPRSRSTEGRRRPGR